MLIDCLLGLSLVGVVGVFLVPRRIVERRSEAVTRGELLGLFPELSNRRRAAHAAIRPPLLVSQTSVPARRRSPHP